MSDLTKEHQAFHAHLDVCKQCAFVAPPEGPDDL